MNAIETLVPAPEQTKALAFAQATVRQARSAARFGPALRVLRAGRPVEVTLYTAA